MTTMHDNHAPASICFAACEDATWKLNESGRFRVPLWDASVRAIAYSPRGVAVGMSYRFARAVVPTASDMARAREMVAG